MTWMISVVESTNDGSDSVGVSVIVKSNAASEVVLCFKKKSTKVKQKINHHLITYMSIQSKINGKRRN